MLVVFIELVDGKFSVAHTNFGKAFAMTHESPGFTHIRVLKDGRVRLGGGQMYTEFHSDTPSPSRVVPITCPSSKESEHSHSVMTKTRIYF